MEPIQIQQALTKNMAMLAHSTLPKSWYKAAGLMRSKKKSLEKHIQAVRREWSRKVSR